MKKIVSFALSVTCLATALALAGCSEKKDPVSELAQDYSGRLQEKLGVSEDDIRETDAGTLTPALAYEGTYYLCADGELPSLDCRVYDNADEARDEFENYYDSFTETFDEDSFEGDYQCYYEGNTGYIVVDGSIPGVDIFGDRYMTGTEVYAGVYYSDNAVVFIVPRNDVSNSDVEEVISLLELPMANGNNA